MVHPRSYAVCNTAVHNFGNGKGQWRNMLVYSQPHATIYLHLFVKQSHDSISPLQVSLPVVLNYMKVCLQWRKEEFHHLWIGQ